MTVLFNIFMKQTLTDNFLGLLKNMNCAFPLNCETFDKGLFHVIGEKLAYSQHQFNRTQKIACYLQLLAFLKTSHRYVLVLKVQGFS